ncbi:MAG: hypothetical protein V2I54_08850 [Bacteroidales bacterium]|jgi:hypothetical protein|nr:hypothetical protein [Bacteroidales bacterium]
MRYYYRIAVLLIYFFACFSSFGQFYSTGQDPLSIKWKQINTDHFQIIFPSDYHSSAQKIANILEYYYQRVGETLDHSPKKISVIVHAQAIRSNGYVSWAPKRMELYPAPAQDMYPGDRLQQLCIHELRHVVQIDKLNQGITKILSLVFGQQATGLVAGQLPMWFYEGDAVATETAFSSFGRGRLPYFKQGIRTILLEGEKEFSFDKVLLGSYREYVPNYYEYGYQFTAYVRAKYGAETWSKVIDHVARHSYTLLPSYFAFNRGLKKHTGLSHREVVDESINYLDSLWTAESKDERYTSSHFIHPAKKDYENYIHPQSRGRGEIVALKKGYSHIPQFVILSEGKEELLWEPGPLISDDFSVSGKFIVWAEYRPDARWHNREFTSIKLFNIDSQEEKLVVDRVRYFSPDISEEANKIAVVEVTPEHQYFLNIISTFDGKVHLQIPSPQGNFIQRPQWSPNERYVYVIEIQGDQKQVSRYDFADRKWEPVFALPGVDIQRILPGSEYLLFHSTYNGTDNLYAYDYGLQNFYQLTHSKNGIVDFDLGPNERFIFASEYTSQGYGVSEIPLERALWHKITFRDIVKDPFAKRLSVQENMEGDSLAIPDQEYTIQKYSRLSNLLYFHSWAPFYFDYEAFNVQDIFADPSLTRDRLYPGMMLLSQNKLSTMETQLGYAYKNNHHFISSSLIYKGLYPYIQITADYGDRHEYFAASDVTWVPELAYDSYNFSVETYIPFNLSRGKYIAGFYPGIRLEHNNRYYYHYFDDYYQEGMEFMNFQVYLYLYTRRAYRDLQPRSGLIIDYNIYNSPFDHDFFGFISTLETQVYLPGFFKDHGFKFNIGYQYQSPGLYLYSSRFRFPRGMERQRTEKLFKLYGDYVFPLAYPDWNLGGLFYIKRIRGALFGDFVANQFNHYTQNSSLSGTTREYFSSLGVELSLDYHFLRTMFPLNTGIRIGYLPGEQSVFGEVLFGIDLYSF